MTGAAYQTEWRKLRADELRERARQDAVVILHRLDRTARPASAPMCR